MGYKDTKRAQNFGKKMTEGRLRAILSRPAPFYPQTINHRDFWDEIIIIRHSPHGIEEIKLTAFMCPTKVDSNFVTQDGYMILENKRPKRMGSYKIGILLSTILGRRGRLK